MLLAAPVLHVRTKHRVGTMLISLHILLMKYMPVGACSACFSPCPVIYIVQWHQRKYGQLQGCECSNTFSDDAGTVQPNMSIYEHKALLVIHTQPDVVLSVSVSLACLGSVKH